MTNEGLFQVLKIMSFLILQTPICDDFCSGLEG